MKKTLFTAILAATLFSGTTNIFAQDDVEGPVRATAIPVGQVIICVVVVDVATVTVDGTDRKISGDDEGAPSGEASFTSIENTESGGTVFSPNSLSFSGTDEQYGDFTFTFDASRPPSNTTLEPNQEDADFPATANVYANVTATFAGADGAVFRNVEECHLVNTSVDTFNPQQNEVYTFENDVEFEADEWGYERIVIRAGSSVVMN